MFRKTHPSRIAFHVVNTIVLGLMALICLYPFWYILIYSLSDATQAQSGVTFWFKGFSLNNFAKVMQLNGIGSALFISVARTLSGTLLSVFACTFMGYLFSKEELPARKFLYRALVVTMYVSGGLIPTYLVVSNLGLVDSMWAVILPGAFSVWNMTIARTYYRGIPQELREAADVDGASELTFFFKILLPVCTPVIAVLVLWQFVAMWNSYFDAMIYLNDSEKQPLQLVLRSILIQNQPESGMIADMQSTAARAQLAELLKYATIIISSLPLLIMYPFFQKYFDSGIMAGAVKG